MAEPDDDALRNTDLLTLCLPGEVRIACRIRRFQYLQLYPDEFTLRCSVPSGRDTEIDKLLDGWGNLLFYGFANADETDLAAWFIGDLAVFRTWTAWHRRQFGRWPGQLRDNRDGTRFMAFCVSEIDPAFIVARSPSGPVLRVA